jgi:hypothetical protein
MPPRCPAERSSVVTADRPAAGDLKFLLGCA